MKARLVLPVIAATAALLAALPGCGGSSSPSGLASLAPPSSVLFVEGVARPSGTLKANVDALASSVAGIPNLGDLIVSKLEQKAKAEGQPVNFKTEVEPWLGSKIAVFLPPGASSEQPDVAIESTEAKAAQAFIDKKAKAGTHPSREASYKGVNFKVESRENRAVGLVGSAVVIAPGEAAFKEVVDASKGGSLAGEARFKEAFAKASQEGIARLYVDLGGLVSRSKGQLTPEALGVFRAAGVNLGEATLVASLMPKPEELELDVKSKLGGKSAPSGDASKLLASLPGESFAALAFPSIGTRLTEAVNSIDAAGIPPKVPPHQLKSALLKVGIDLEKVTASIHDGAVFATGSDKASLGGALVLTTDNPQALAQTISSIGLLVRGSTKVQVTPLNGKLTGFAVTSKELGPKPVVVATGTGRMVIAYGMPAAEAAAGATAAQPLSANPNFAAAKAALGGTPISGFADGPAALRLAESLVPRSEHGFQEAKPYLKKIRFVALGASSEGEYLSARLIAGVAK